VSLNTTDPDTQAHIKTKAEDRVLHQRITLKRKGLLIAKDAHSTLASPVQALTSFLKDL
jgi:hypothetical protein